MQVQGRANMAISRQQTKTGSSKDEEKRQELGYILKAESRGFIDALGSMDVEGKTKIKNCF